LLIEPVIVPGLATIFSAPMATYTPPEAEMLPKPRHHLAALLPQPVQGGMNLLVAVPHGAARAVDAEQQGLDTPCSST
jgi:hypothetical protein